MSKVDIIRAWKDEGYRNSLSAEELALVPEHPSGAIELADDDLSQVAGGTGALCLTYVSRCDPCTLDVGCTSHTFPI